MKTAISGTHFQSDDDVIHAVDDCLNGQEKDFFKSGIEAFKHHWEKCIDTEGDYVEKIMQQVAKIHIFQYEAHNISISPHIQTRTLSLFQTTNFRLFQTERVADDKFKFHENGQKLRKSRKYCGKRRNCSLRAISPFPTVFSKELYCKHVKTRACLGKGYR